MTAPLEIAAVPPVPATALAFPEEWTPSRDEPLPVPPQPVSLKEFHDRERGKRFGDKVHLVLEAAPPVTSPWPPPGPLPQAVSWEGGEEARWREIAGRIAASPFHAALCRTAPVGTEVPLLSCRDGESREERADLVVRAARAPGPGGEGGEEYWIVDYKTGRRERDAEAAYAGQVRDYMDILAAAWNVPVRGFLWYLDTGDAVEIDGL